VRRVPTLAPHELVLRLFGERAEWALGHADLPELIRQYFALGLVSADRVPGWLRYVGRRALSGAQPSSPERELVNHYVARLGGTGVPTVVRSGGFMFGVGGCCRTSQAISGHVAQLRLHKARSVAIAMPGVQRELASPVRSKPPSRTPLERSLPAPYRSFPLGPPQGKLILARLEQEEQTSKGANE
jgi:hypothetical protein